MLWQHAFQRRLFRRLHRRWAAEVAGFVRCTKFPATAIHFDSFQRGMGFADGAGELVEQGKAPVSQVVADTAGIPPHPAAL